MTSVHLEMLVEPFREDQPGPHVLAAVSALEQTGLTVEMGPFASIADGELQTLLDAVAAALKAGFAQGAERISVSVERT
jgi:uncharacterized protein YqgV (UPF0045/DUF77 family)